jgi:hypothetical protein
MKSTKYWLKSAKYFRYFLIAAVVFFLFFGVISCRIDGKKIEGNQNQQKTSQVISLLDSLGVGDVPIYPRAKYDKELNDKLGEFKNQLPEIPAEFTNVLYTVFTTNDTPSEVIDHYNSEMKQLEWNKSLDLTSGEGGFMVWKKASNRGTDISYIVLTGQIQFGGRKEVVILTGLVIPDYGNGDDHSTAATLEGNEIGPGSIYFENPQPPEGEGLLPTKSISMGVDEWQKWLQEGSKVKGTNKIYISDDLMFQKVVEFYRTSDPDDGGAAGVYQNLDIDLSRFSKINIWLVGKILSEKGGNIANVNPSFFPEGAVQVRIKYLTENKNEKEWYHSFFYSNIIYYDKLHYNLVTREKWFWYISPNLLELEDKPVKIEELRIYGFGWQFRGQVADVNIIGI